MIALADGGASTSLNLDVGYSHWAVLGGVVGALLAIDLWRNRVAHAPSGRQALIDTAFWIGCGLAFSAYVWVGFGVDAFGSYMAGYLIEKSLSVDNVFIWSVVFSTMAIPLKYQHRVLFWGIFGALVFRALFVFAGVKLVEEFKPILFIFGAFLVFTGTKIFTHAGKHDDTASTKGLELLKKVMPVTTELDGQRFFTRVNGQRAATPLLATLVIVELTDVVFAIDSVPAIIAITSEPFIVLSSNAFAILGLRAMYFLLADAREKFTYLNHALGVILVLVGVKMLVSYWYHSRALTWISLGVISVILLVAILASLRKSQGFSSDDRANTR